MLPDVEEHHEREETDIPALIRKLEAQEEERKRERATSSDPVPTSDGGSGIGSTASTADLKRLTQHKNKNGSVSSQLAFDDLTGMELEAGKVIEARGKEMQYVRDSACTARYLGVRRSATAGIS